MTDKIEDKEALLDELNSQIVMEQNMPQQIILNVIALMKSYEINRLALWSKNVDYDARPQYNEEDSEIFGSISPEFWINLRHGIEGDDRGCIIAVELNNRRADPLQKLQLVGEDECDKFVFRVSAADVVNHEEQTEADFFEVMKAVVLSIRFNLDHNIPVEKWGVCHHPYVDPYSYEYIE